MADDDRVTCPACGGTGKVFPDDMDGQPGGGTCGQCGGTGSVAR